MKLDSFIPILANTLDKENLVANIQFFYKSPIIK